MQGPTAKHVEALQEMLREAKHRTVADAFLKGFLWAVWPDWYEEVYKQAKEQK